MNVEQWLGKDNKLGVDIFNRKYRKGNETFEQWLDRVSGGDDAVRTAIKSKRFLFGGRILSNRGVIDTKVTYSNCYVVASPFMIAARNWRGHIHMVVAVELICLNSPQLERRCIIKPSRQLARSALCRDIARQPRR